MARLSSTFSPPASPTAPSALPSTISSNPPIAPSSPKIKKEDDDDDDDDDEWPDQDAIDTTPVPMDESLYPGGTRDLCWIGLQAFVLGNICTGGIAVSAVLLLCHESAWWRLSAFCSVLAVFHFLEYWTTARYNTAALRADSFLLFSNGKQYNIAHGLAMTEIVLGCLFPRYGQAFVGPLTIAAGAAMVVLGQVVRSFAMAQAGVSFNHVIAREHKETHKLVTHGLYAYFRHPSYFGFFWWAIGTQFLVGNKVCLVGYSVILWRFFFIRIRAEEKYLVEFFGQIYVEYRARTGTKIPFIP